MVWNGAYLYHILKARRFSGKHRFPGTGRETYRTIHEIALSVHDAFGVLFNILLVLQTYKPLEIHYKNLSKKIHYKTRKHLISHKL